MSQAYLTERTRAIGPDGKHKRFTTLICNVLCNQGLAKNRHRKNEGNAFHWGNRNKVPTFMRDRICREHILAK